MDILEGRDFNAVTLGLAAIGALAGVVAVVLAIIFGVKSLRPRRPRLSVSALAPASLLTPDSKEVDDLRLRYGGKDLSEPYIATFVLENRGNAHLDSSCFDQGRPIRLDLGVKILAVLKVSLQPGQPDSFVHERKKTAILLGPDVLKPGQQLVVQLLVEREPHLEHPLQARLTNADIEYLAPGSASTFKVGPKMNIFLKIYPIAVFLIFLVSIIAMFSGPRGNVKFTPEGARSGQQINIEGDDFAPNHAIRVSVQCNYGGDPFTGGGSDSYPMLEIVADSKGEFRTSAIVPVVPNLTDCTLTAWQNPTGFHLAAIGRQDF